MKICDHIKDNGSTCGSPALTGYDYCYFHQRLRQPRHRPGDFEYKLPILDTPESILMAIQHITQAALDGILEPSRARLVLSALRLAKATLKEINQQDGLQQKNEEENRLDAARPRAATTTAQALSSRAPQLGEGSASCPNHHDSPLHNDHNRLPDRGGAGLQPRVEGRKEIEALAPVPKKLPLSATQLKLMKKILRRGPSDPRFSTAARLLDSQTSRGRSA